MDPTSYMIAAAVVGSVLTLMLCYCLRFARMLQSLVLFQIKTTLAVCLSFVLYDKFQNMVTANGTVSLALWGARMADQAIAGVAPWLPGWFTVFSWPQSV